MRTTSDRTASTYDGVARLPLSLSLPHKGGGDPQTGVVASEGLASGAAELRAAALMFGTAIATSSPPPLWGRDRERGTRPLRAVSISNGSVAR
jgi:hypothetical protein